MFDLLDVELLVLGIGGAALAGLTVIEAIAPFTVRAVLFVIGCIMLAIALVEIVTN